MMENGPRQQYQRIRKLLLVLTAMTATLFPPTIYPATTFLFFVFAGSILCLLLLDGEVGYPGPAVVLLGVCFLITTLMAEVPFTSVRYLSLFAAYGVFFAAGRTDGEQSLYRWFLLMGCAGVLYGVYQFFWGFAFQLSRLEAADFAQKAEMVRYIEEGRAFSFFSTPASFAGFLGLLTPVALVSAVSARRVRDRLVLSAALGALLTGILLSFSYGALLALAAALLCGAWRRILRSPKWALSISLGALGVLALFGWFREENPLAIAAPHHPLAERVGNWEVALLMWRDFPILGTGNGGFGLLAPQYIQRGMIETKFVHNSFLQLGVENGALVFPFFFAFLWRFMRQCNRPRGGDLTTWGFGVACAVFLIQNMVDFTFYLPEVGWLFFFFLGVLFQDRDIGSRSRTRRTQQVPRWVGVSFAFLLIGLQLLVYLEATMLDRAALAMERGDLGEGLKFARWAQRAAPIDPHGAAFYGQLLLDLGDIDSAKGKIEMAIRGDPHTPYFRHVEGLIHLAREEPVGAYRSFRSAHLLFPIRERYGEEMRRIADLIQEQGATAEQSKRRPGYHDPFVNDPQGTRGE